jgi:hypothetical protein
MYADTEQSSCHSASSRLYCCNRICLITRLLDRIGTSRALSFNILGDYPGFPWPQLCRIPSPSAANLLEFCRLSRSVSKSRKPSTWRCSWIYRNVSARGSHQDSMSTNLEKNANETAVELGTQGSRMWSGWSGIHCRVPTLEDWVDQQ